MRMSDKVGSLAAALSKAQADFPLIPKNKRAKIPLKNGGTYEYWYADLADVISAVTPILAQNELSISQDPGMHILGEKMISGIWTTVMHSSGEWKSSFLPMNDFDKAQEQGSEITYKRRYTLNGVLGIHPEDDDDGAAASNEKPKVPPPRAPENPPSKAGSLPPQAARPPPPKEKTNAELMMEASRWIIPFGKKLRGKAIGDVPEAELRSYASWLSLQPPPENETLRKNADDFFVKMDIIFGGPPK